MHFLLLFGNYSSRSRISDYFSFEIYVKKKTTDAGQKEKKETLLAFVRNLGSFYSTLNGHFDLT